MLKVYEVPKLARPSSVGKLARNVRELLAWVAEDRNLLEGSLGCIRVAAFEAKRLERSDV